jgi:carbonic anhydrase
MPSPRIIRVTSADGASLDQVRDLFTEYAEWLSPFVTRSAIAEELRSLPAPFVVPDGVLLAACDSDGRLCGCVGVKRHSETECEIKRLFVRPECRGTGLGYALFSTALDAACEVGYEVALVSTIPSFMPEANAMYERLGFERTDCFEDHTHADAEISYLSYSLSDWCP